MIPGDIPGTRYQPDYLHLFVHLYLSLPFTYITTSRSLSFWFYLSADRYLHLLSYIYLLHLFCRSTFLPLMDHVDRWRCVVARFSFIVEFYRSFAVLPIYLFIYTYTFHSITIHRCIFYLLHLLPSTPYIVLFGSFIVSIYRSIYITFITSIFYLFVHRIVHLLHIPLVHLFWFFFFW